MSTSVKPALQSPTASKGGSKASSADIDKIYAARQEFLMAALGMSWQLAIVVLVPILGGWLLDKQFDTRPLWTLVGFVVAMAGFVVVVWGAFRRFSPPVTKADIENAKRLREREGDDD